MRVHILGICGTFMGGLALLARERGDSVSGCDAAIYPPMSEQLEASGITLTEGFAADQLDADHDAVVVGNALTRGNPCVERLLDEKRSLISGPAWLAEHVLGSRTVLAVAGTHGKTTTASILAWILEYCGLNPGFLIGGVPRNFGLSARMGSGEVFVVEADEYDTAFFDKRSKFVHYRPHVLIVNNLEFDHADIFRDLQDIRRQFHHAVRLVPRNGLVVAAGNDPEIDALLEMGCYSALDRFGIGDDISWNAISQCEDASRFTLRRQGMNVAEVSWELIGEHNVRNALAAVAAADAVGVDPIQACEALSDFVAPRRRMELIAQVRGISVYDDFAHHPTAILSTLTALRAAVGTSPIVAVVDPTSNTMRMGVHNDSLGPSLRIADRVLFHGPSTSHLDLEKVIRALVAPSTICDDVEGIISILNQELHGGEHVLIMSNSGFDALPRRLLERLQS